MKPPRCLPLLLLGAQAVTGRQLQDLPAARAAMTTSAPSAGPSPSITQPPSCGGQIVNAPGADLIYWDPDVHTFALSVVQCSTVWAHGSIQGVSYYTVDESTDFPFPHTSSTKFTAAATIVTTIQDPLVTGTYVMTTTMTSAGSVQTSVISSRFVKDAQSSDYDLTNVIATVTPSGQAPVSIKGGVPILLISELEVEFMSAAGGSCATQTSTTRLASPLILSLSGTTSWPGPGTASGSLPAAVTSAVAADSGAIAAGTFNGLPTVAIASQSIFPILCREIRPFQHLNSGTSVLPPQSLNIAPGSNPTGSPSSGASPSNGASGSFGETGSSSGEDGASNAGSSTSGATLTYQGATYTAAADGAFNIAGSTLAPGHQVTLAGGTTLSLVPSGTAVIEQYGGTTSTLPVAVAQGTMGGVFPTGANGPPGSGTGHGGAAGAQNDDPLTTTSSGSRAAPTSNDAAGRRSSWSNAGLMAAGLVFWAA